MRLGVHRETSTIQSAGSARQSARLAGPGLDFAYVPDRAHLQTSEGLRKGSVALNPLVNSVSLHSQQSRNLGGARNCSHRHSALHRRVCHSLRRRYLTVGIVGHQGHSGRPARRATRSMRRGCTNDLI